MVMKKLTIITCVLLLLTAVYAPSIHAVEPEIDVTANVVWPPMEVVNPGGELILDFGDTEHGQTNPPPLGVPPKVTVFVKAPLGAPFNATIDGGLNYDGEQRRMKRVTASGTYYLAYALVHNGDPDRWEANIPHTGFEGAGASVLVPVDIYGHIGTPPVDLGSTPDWTNVAVGAYTDTVNITFSYF